MNILKTDIRKNIEISVCLALICTIMLSFAHFDTACEDLRKNILRLHIIANSDSAVDQNVKLKVRDAILEKSDYIFKDCDSLETAVVSANKKIEYINAIANEALRKYGFSYVARVRIGDRYFETREYDEFTLPAGNYKSLIIKLGKAQGKNWWCVVFPKVCLSSCEENAELSDSTKEESAKIAESPKKYKVKFKVIEWYEDFKRWIKKK